MKWMRERDLLIAQTMAFVQSVTGKTLETERMAEAEKTVTASVALLSVETSKTIRTVATLPDAALPDIKSLLAETSRVTQASREVSREETPRAAVQRPAPLARLDLREDFQSEIKARVANFRAHQERFNREREAYCSATMAKVHAALREGEPPTRPGK
jgi:hypothetical protein